MKSELMFVSTTFFYGFHTRLREIKRIRSAKVCILLSEIVFSEVVVFLLLGGIVIKMINVSGLPVFCHYYSTVYIPGSVIII